MKTIFNLVLAISAGVMVVGCGDQATPSSSVLAAAPVAPATPKHLYAIKDGHEYGYEQGISENDRQQGQAAVKLLMFSYLGRKGDTYQVMLKSDSVRTVAECAKPCEFAKVYTFVGDRFMGKEMMKLTPEVIVSAVFFDAMSGQLELMMGEQKGVATTFWVDGNAKQLVVADAKTSGVVR